VKEGRNFLENHLKKLDQAEGGIAGTIHRLREQR
jgi:hypothetical protein